MEDDDPLELKDLAVKFDYLMFRINDHLAALADATWRSVEAKRTLIEEDYFGRQLQLDAELARADAVVAECTQLEAMFMKLDQLYTFVGEFKARLAALEREYASLT